MRNLNKFMIVVALLLAGIGFSRAAYAEDPLQYFRIGTGAVAGTSFTVGEAIAAAVSGPPGAPPCDARGRCGVPGLIAIAQSTDGELDNLARVDARLLDASLGRADLVSLAWRGKPPFAKVEAHKNLRFVASLYAEAFHLVVAKGSSIQGPSDLRDKRVAVGVPRSGTRVAAELVLRAFGLSANQVSLVEATAGQSADLLSEGQIDAFFFVGGVPAPLVADLVEDEVARVVPIKGGAIEQIAILHRYYDRAPIPARAYGNASPIDTLAVTAALVVHQATDAALVYEITKALWHKGNRALFAASHAGVAAYPAFAALKGAPVRIHPGAARFYEEIGLLVPLQAAAKKDQ